MKQVDKLCKYYGPFIGHVGDVPFHDFPTPDALSGQKVEAHLRELGFGYRAKYIAETARLITEDKPHGWLDSLANPENPGWASLFKACDSNSVPTYKTTHEQLLSLAGVGPKVADCVCLMGLGWGEAVPVDTHVWQIAQRDYKLSTKGKTKTFSKVLYDEVGDHFRKIWGPQAGWAQSVLFTANLKSFSEQLAGKAEEANIKVEDKDVKVEFKETITEQEPTGRGVKRKVIIEATALVKGKATTETTSRTRKRKTRA